MTEGETIRLLFDTFLALADAKGSVCVSDIVDTLRDRSLACGPMLRGDIEDALDMLHELEGCQRMESAEDGREQFWSVDPVIAAFIASRLHALTATELEREVSAKFGPQRTPSLAAIRRYKMRVNDAVLRIP